MSTASLSTYARYICMCINTLPVEVAKLIDSYIPLNIYQFGGFYNSDGNKLESKSFMLTINVPATERKWTSLPNIPTARFCDKAAVILNNRYVYVTGGTTTAGTWNIVEVFDIVTSTWTVATPMQFPHREHIAMSCNDKIFIIDTWGGQSEIYNVLTDVWTSFSVPNVRWMGAILWRNSRIFVFGGKVASYASDFHEQSNITSQCEYFDIATQNWVVIANMLTPRWGTRAAILYDDCIAVMGGSISKYSTDGSTDIVELYNPITNKWSVAEWKLPKPMYDFGIHQLDDYRFIIHDTHLPFPHWLYHNNDNSWELLPFVPP